VDAVSAVDIGIQQVLLTSSTHCRNLIIFPFVTSAVLTLIIIASSSDNSVHYNNCRHTTTIAVCIGTYLVIELK